MREGERAAAFVDPASDIEVINTELGLADLQTIENQIKTKDLQIGNLKNEIINKDDIITTMKNRNLTFKERWSGKIILNKNEN